MGKLVRGWALVDQVLGPYLAGRLRTGLPIDIAAENGQIYRIDPRSQRLINLTTKELYCVHPIDGNNYCFPDMVVVWWDYIHLKVNEIERVVGGPDSGHRTPWFEGEGKFGTCIEPRNFATADGMSYSIENSKRAVQQFLQNPSSVIDRMPPSFRRQFDIYIASFMDFYSRGLFSWSTEVREVVENENTEDEAGQAEDYPEGYPG